jgi:ssDNA-specific exonuclease RecJ
MSITKFQLSFIFSLFLNLSFADSNDGIISAFYINIEKNSYRINLVEDSNENLLCLSYENVDDKFKRC